MGLPAYKTSHTWTGRTRRTSRLCALPSRTLGTIWEEIFGPVLSVLKARDFDEALKTANDTPYGLTGGVHSRNRDHLEQAKTEFKAGNIYFNRGITGALVGVQPFGGYGLSGTDSKAGGPDYLPLHMLPRTVVERF
jgi:1-pyrroline-5-carboxylate dehydrogenase